MRQSTIALLVLLATTIFAAWFFTTHEKRLRHEFTGYRGEARVNDYLAADMLLNELDIEADSRASLIPSEWLPEYGDTIVTRLSTNIAIGAERDLLTAWVADGGHLVLLPPENESRIVDEFLQSLGFRLVTHDEDEVDEGGEDESENDGDEDDYEYLVDLDDTWYRIEMADESTLGARLSDELGAVAARRTWVSGYVTVLASANYFTNYSLDQSSHARLLLDAVAGYVEPGKVWFIYDAAFPALWQVIWDNAPFIVIGLMIVLITWLWSIMPTFGPAIRPDRAVRRSILEHVRAAGHFSWRNQGVRALASSSAAAVMHEAETRHPGIGRLPTQDQARQIAKLTGLTAQEILDVLIDQETPRHREFTHNMQALQQIRKRL
jgi:hypothetical protein